MTKGDGAVGARVRFVAATRVGVLVFCGSVSAAILSFTATRDDFAVSPPSEAYIRTIVSGLEETYPCMRKSEILDYLSCTEGIRDAIPDDVLAAWTLGL